MARWIIVGLLGLVACATPDDDVTGPYTGDIHRYQIDDIHVPRSNAEARSDGIRDAHDSSHNQLGSLTSTLAGFGDLVTARDVIGSGVVQSVVEIQADDLGTDDTVAIWYLGRDGDAATPVGARLRGGAAISNHQATSTHLGQAFVRLPIFIDAAPTAFTMYGLEIDLEPDPAGGFTGTVRGGVTLDDALEAIYLGMSEMFATNLPSHRSLRYMFDANHDGVIVRSEITNNQILNSLLVPDLELPEGPALSFAFRVHLRDCDRAPGCTPVPVVDTCHDRVLDHGESDLDCGGDCAPCSAGKSCVQGSDCDSTVCTGETCAAPTCNDGLLDGFESDVDCGGTCDVRCAVGKRCIEAGDCASQVCSGFCQ